MTIRAHSSFTAETSSAASPLPSLPRTSASVDGSARTLTELALTYQIVPPPCASASGAGDALTFTATAQSLAYVLDQQLGLTFTGDFYENYGGRQERWLLGDGSQWYFLVPDGRLFAWDGGSSGSLVGNVGAYYWADPNRLIDVPTTPYASLAVTGTTLTVSRAPASTASAIYITVTASDGRGGTSSRTFTVTVTN